MNDKQRIDAPTSWTGEWDCTKKVTPIEIGVSQHPSETVEEDQRNVNSSLLVYGERVLFVYLLPMPACMCDTVVTYVDCMSDCVCGVVCGGCGRVGEICLTLKRRATEKINTHTHPASST